MKRILTLLTLLTVVAFSAMSQISVITIDSARMQGPDGNPLDSGVTVQITGIAYGPNQYPTSNGMAFFLNDGTTGIKIYSKHVYSAYPVLHDGDSIVVVGTLGGYHGAAEVDLAYGSLVDTIYQVGTSSTQAPVVVLATGLNEQTYGLLVEVDNVNMSAAAAWGAVTGKHSFTANSGGLYMFVDSFMNAAMYNATQPQGMYNVRGFSDQYKYSPPYTSGFNIDPRNLDDFIPVGSNGIREIQNTLTAAIYPNPASSYLMVGVVNDKEETLTAQMFDLTGRQVFNETRPTNIGLNSIQFNTSSLTDGLYMLELHTSDKSLVKKIIIAR